MAFSPADISLADSRGFLRSVAFGPRERRSRQFSGREKLRRPVQAGACIDVAPGLGRFGRLCVAVDFSFALTFGSRPMGLFRKKTDPISERARDLNEQIAALEEQIAS